MNPERPPARDVFGWISEIDAASIVMVSECGLASDGDAAAAARAVLAVREAAGAPGAARPADYLDIQPLLRAEAGPAADAVHLGRSRQDILATVHRLLLRDRVIDVTEALLALRRELLAAASRQPHALVPAYTNGVQAQPTTFGHLLTGYEAAFARASERLSQAFTRVNRSPLGAAALATTSYAVDRDRLAVLLGFEAAEEHALDAAQLAPIDVGLDAAAAAMGLALTVSTLVQDLSAQFHHARPWLVLDGADLTSPSTLMPQKRNPVALGYVRLLASQVLGDGVRTSFTGHNVASGVTDYKRYDAADTLERAERMIDELLGVVRGIRLVAADALAELGLDFATASEAARVLESATDLSPSGAHAVISALVDDARRDGVGSAGLDDARIERVYAQVVGTPLPVAAARVRAAFDPRAMVDAARGKGGPQPAELERLLDVARRRLETDERLLASTRTGLGRADAERQRALLALARR